MDSIAVRVCGKKYITSRANWERIPAVAELLKGESPYVLEVPDRGFVYVFEWLITNKYHIDCPSTELYEVLVTTAERLGLSELSAALKNRVSLCRYVRLGDGMDFYICDLTALRKVRNLGGILARVLEGHVRFLSNGTDIICTYDCGPFMHVLANPETARKGFLYPQATTVDRPLCFAEGGPRLILSAEAIANLHFVSSDKKAVRNHQILRSAVALFGDAMRATIKRRKNKYYVRLHYEPRF